MSRPADGDWYPLGLGGDPVPGDPQLVTQEAQHLSSIATTLLHQIQALREISSNGTEVGEHAEKIRSAASGLIGSLEKVELRYAKVAAALTGWVPQLENAQRMSLQALQDAEGPYSKLKNTPAPNIPGLTQGLNGQWTLNPFQNHTSAQTAQFDVYQQAMTRAQGELQDAQNLLGRAVTLRNNEASHYAGLINTATSDGLKDSWWEGFENWVEDGWDDFTSFVAANAGIFKDICTVLEVIATILAVVAIFVSGGTLLLLIGAILTGIALVGRLMLVASGKGSWLDVIMDVVALVSFGATEWLNGAVDAAVDGAKALGETEFMADETEMWADQLNEVWETMGPEAGAQARDEMFAVLVKQAKTLVPEVDDKVPWAVRMFGTGDKDGVVAIRNLQAIKTTFSDSDQVVAMANKGLAYSTAQTWNFRIATTVGVSAVTANGISWDHNDGETMVHDQLPRVGAGWNRMEKATGDKD